MNDFTLILNSASNGDPHGSDEILPIIYDELRRLAQYHMSKEFGAHTLQATALVHEAWLRMVENDDRTWENRNSFFSAASLAMRRILVEHARRKARLKHGGNLQRLNIDEMELADAEKEETILLVDDALERLEAINPLRAKIVVMKFFGGMTNKQAADTLGISERSVERHWVCAKTWLLKAIRARM